MYRLPEEYVHRGMIFAANMFPKEALLKIENTDFKDDVIVSSYPKTGTIWTSKIVDLIQHQDNIEAAKASTAFDRVKFIEFKQPGSDHLEIDLIRKAPHPQVLRCHLTPKFFGDSFPTDVKFIVVIRNPKDMLVSLYNFYKSTDLYGPFRGTWDEFFKIYVKKYLVYGDFFDWYLEWLPYLNKPNVLLVHYEDLKTNLGPGLQRIAEFMGKPLSEDKVQEIAELVSFKSMSTSEVGLSYINKNAPFMRKGVIGDWKNYFSSEQSQQLEERYQETLLKAGIEFRFE